MNDITKQETSFKTLSYTLSSSLNPYVKLDGFSSEGVQWETVEKTTFRQGADGLSAKNSKPVLYKCTMTFLPNADCVPILDTLVFATTPQYGKTLVKNTIVLTVKNEMTGATTVYSGGDITNAPGGDSANLDDGQSDKEYQFTFTNKVVLPVA